MCTGENFATLANVYIIREERKPLGNNDRLLETMGDTPIGRSRIDARGFETISGVVEIRN